MRTLDGKKCLVTGAASGIGRATALAAARGGATLVLTDRNEELLARTVNDVRAARGGVVVARTLDISDFDAVRAFADGVHAELGSLDVVMNVAGISVWGTVENLEHHHWRRVVDVNLMGPIHVIECFVPEMILVFTSRDVRVVHFIQNKLGFLYERLMRRLNGQMQRTAETHEPS